MTQSLDEVLAKIEELKQQAESMIANEKAAIVADMKSKIEKYKITASDLGLVAQYQSIPLSGQKVKKLAEAKYQNPLDTSQTWSGKGRRPKWFIDLLGSGESEEYYTIKK
jgi:DNA-binding protein H-NS